MKKHIAKILAFACIAAVTLSFSCTNAQDLTPAAGFELQDLEQQVYVLSGNKANTLILFWTTWCPYCPDELQELNRMRAGFAKEGTEVLAVNAGERPEQVKSFVSRYKLSYRVLLDTDMKVAKSYKVLGVPTYLLIDKSGNVVFKGNYFPKDKYKKLISE